MDSALIEHRMLIENMSVLFSLISLPFVSKFQLPNWSEGFMVAQTLKDTSAMQETGV